jgi:hypothetical protein
MFIIASALVFLLAPAIVKAALKRLERHEIAREERWTPQEILEREG